MNAFRLAIACTILAALPLHAAEIDDQVTFSIPSQSLSSALLEFAEQSSIQVLTASTQLEGYQTRGVQGHLSAREALHALLAGTGLSFKRVGTGTVTIARLADGKTQTSQRAEENAASRLHLAQASDSATNAGARAAKASTGEKLEEVTLETKGIPEILVEGTRILNMDIARSRDDPQPYVIFDRETIERSGVNSLEEFLRQRLPMNATAVSNAQLSNEFGNRSNINLRGLGANQTLVLVDGHRVALPSALASVGQQADINGLPLAAIERIEVLPTTASGIYGGSATGGVINIILRRDYSGLETRLTYDNTFQNDSAARRIDMSGGLTLEDGKTNVLFAGSYSQADPLLIGDRDFVRNGRQRVFANNPEFYLRRATPPQGSTPNIRSVDGSPLFGPGTPSYTSVPRGYAGGGGLGPLAANAGTFNFDLVDTVQREGARSALLNAPKVESLQLTLRRQFGSKVQAFLEAAGSNNRSRSRFSFLDTRFMVAANAPNNPFGKAIFVTVPTAAADMEVVSETEDRRLVGGLILSLPGSWQAEADFTWNRSAFTYAEEGAGRFSSGASTAVRSGTLDVLRDTMAFPLDFSPYADIGPRTKEPFNSTLKDATLRLGGPLAKLPAGNIALTALVERRDEIYGDGTYSQGLYLSDRYLPERSQSVDSAYLETRIPLVSAANRLPGIRELELQLGVRRDEYAINGTSRHDIVGRPVRRERARMSSTDFTLGLRYQPIPSVMLRASYGTGFLPPSVQQLVPDLGAVGSDCGTVIDPRRGNEVAPVLCGKANGNPDLKPEQSQSWSAGVVLTPAALPGLRLSVDYTRIEKSDNISGLSQEQMYVDNESLFSGLVERAAPEPGDPFGVGRITTLNLLLVNIAKAQVEAYDVALDYRWQTQRLGTLDLFVLATWQPHYQTQLVPGAPLVENVGISGIADVRELGGNAGVVWKYGPWTSSWSTRYFDSYLVADPAAPTSATTIRNQGHGGRVPSQIYHDLQIGYEFGTTPGSSGSSWTSRALSNTEVRLGVKNVFDTEPPFVQSGLYYSTLGDPRLASYYLTLRKSF